MSFQKGDHLPRTVKMATDITQQQTFKPADNEIIFLSFSCSGNFPTTAATLMSASFNSLLTVCHKRSSHVATRNIQRTNMQQLSD
jgi:hypothetical protein